MSGAKPACCYNDRYGEKDRQRHLHYAKQRLRAGKEMDDPRQEVAGPAFRAGRCRRLGGHDDGIPNFPPPYCSSALSLEMATSRTPRNRKERRAQAKSNIGNANHIPFAQPARDAPKQKTLLEIAAERQLLSRSSSSNNTDLNPETTSIVTINPDGSLSNTPEAVASGAEAETVTPWLDIALYTTTLILLHFTLTLLVTHQYSHTRPEVWPLFLSSTVFSRTPFLLLLLVAILHPRASHPAMQIGFTAMAIAAGGYLVKISNEDPYMAVMKQAPELGTLWVWSVVECRWELALAGVLAVAGWGWTKGYVFW